MVNFFAEHGVVEWDRPVGVVDKGDDFSTIFFIFALVYVLSLGFSMVY